MALNIALILRAVLDEYVLPWDGDHGIAHWARVLENGLRLAEETPIGWTSGGSGSCPHPSRLCARRPGGRR